jgi:chromosome segregation ATPase
MKYAQIQALVPTAEHFDESGIINEGGFLSVAHLNNIEQTLATNAPALEQANATIEAHVATIEEKETAITTMQANIDKATTLSATQAATIATLQAQIVELGKNPSSKSGSEIATKQDEQHVEVKNERPRFDSPEHPANQAAKALVKQQSK